MFAILAGVVAGVVELDAVTPAAFEALSEHFGRVPSRYDDDYDDEDDDAAANDRTAPGDLPNAAVNLRVAIKGVTSREPSSASA